ncbi:splicing factor U2AF 50 kDa subunit-like [Teleopsis dalmanni]|uniref:splicing factor U2AF 50 kDa subunit-like n=1 Tax=Teleopsis dalmanni TaxID=139649 RepID=UPI0018CCC41B|nr:splicing factor U2AF 50 kDa subunit-like [Teleopsis dalmanni]
MESIDNDNGCTPSSKGPKPMMNEAMKAHNQTYIQCETPEPNLHTSLVKKGRNARRIFVSNLPDCVNMFKLKFFINKQMHLGGLSKEIGNSVISCYINCRRKFAFLIFRSVEEAESSLDLDGVVYEGKILKICRPRSYRLPPGEISTTPIVAPLVISGLTSTLVPDSEHKIFFGGLIVNANNEEVCHPRRFVH